MEELIYNFLLQSNYPRASIITDSTLLESRASDADLLQPDFVIVDPETVQPLAIVTVVDAIDDELLREVSIDTRNYAAKLAGKAIQGFVIRVDLDGANEQEQVQFYRIWPNKSLQQLTSQSFPDIDTLKVARKLADTRKAKADEIQERNAGLRKDRAEAERRKPGLLPRSFGLYFPAMLILALVLIDGVMLAVRGTPLLTLTQSVLFIGAALLFLVPAAIRYIRQ